MVHGKRIPSSTLVRQYRTFTLGSKDGNNDGMNLIQVGCSAFNILSEDGPQRIVGGNSIYVGPYKGGDEFVTIGGTATTLAAIDLGLTEI